MAVSAPAELRHQRPSRPLLGYRCAEVDQIMLDATPAFKNSGMERPRANLEDRVHELEVQVNEVKDTEQALRDALVTAQRAADEMRASASRDTDDAIPRGRDPNPRYVDKVLRRAQDRRLLGLRSAGTAASARGCGRCWGATPAEPSADHEEQLREEQLRPA